MMWPIPFAYALFLLLLVYRYATRRPRLSDYAPQAAGPLVSVIIPARNEAVNIEECVRSAAATDYQAVEVIVVDDRSSDGTAEIVERIAAALEARGGVRVGVGVRLVRGAELPVGWFGKQWAMVQGYRAARGELLLFMDADTRQHPELIPRAVRALELERVDLLSVLSHQEMISFWERLVQPHVFFALATRVGDLRRVNRTRVEWDAIASGQFILTTRAAYETVGTHESVRNIVVDDMALAQTFIRHHLDIFLTHAEEFMSTRMYRNLAGILEGWTKNFGIGIPLAFPPIPLVRRLAPYIMWLPALVWIAPPVLWALLGWAWAAWTTGISLLIWVMVYRVAKAPVRYALLYPVGAATVAYIMIRSALRGSRRIEWRGRSYRSV